MTRSGIGRVENESSIASRDTAHGNDMAAYHFGGICVSRWVVEGESFSRQIQSVSSGGRPPGSQKECAE